MFSSFLSQPAKVCLHQPAAWWFKDQSVEVKGAGTARLQDVVHQRVRRREPDHRPDPQIDDRAQVGRQVAAEDDEHLV